MPIFITSSRIGVSRSRVVAGKTFPWEATNLILYTCPILSKRRGPSMIIFFGMPDYSLSPPLGVLEYACLSHLIKEPLRICSK